MITLSLIGLVLTVSLVHGINNIQETTNTSMNWEDESILAEEEIDWWPMFQRDLSNTGFSTSSGPITNNIAWYFHADGKINSPSVVDGNIYFGTNTKNASYWSDSVLYCLDVRGNILWDFSAKGNLDTSPAIYKGKVFIGSDTGHFYCLDAFTGNIIWSEKVAEKAVSSPIISEDKLIIASLDGNVYCLNSNTGKILWKTGISINILSTPAINQGQIYLRNYCLDLSDGKILWRSEIGIALLSSPTFYEDKIYIGSGDEKIYCLNASTGEKLWRFYTGSMSYQTSPAVAYGNVYVGNAFGFIYCINATTGEYLWSTKKSPRAVSSPTISDGKMYIGSMDNHFYCLDAFTGETIWSFESKEDFFSSPAIANDYVFSPSGNTLYCFGEPIESNARIKCTDTLSFTDVKPSPYITVNFTVANIGDIDSSLNWEIVSFPEWGKWEASSIKGHNLSSNDDPVIIDVTIKSPAVKNESFIGQIKVVNSDNIDDYELIDISLATVKNKGYLNPLFRFFETLVDFFPVFFHTIMDSYC